MAEAEAAGDRESLAHAYRILGRVDFMSGDLAMAATHWDRALSLYEELADLEGQGAITNNLGLVAYDLGDWGTAREHLDRALSIYERAGDQDSIAVAKSNLAQLLCERGLLAEAAALSADALRIFQAAGYRAAVAKAQRELALIAARAGDHERARQLIDEAHVAFQDIGAGVDDISTRQVMAESQLLRGLPRPALAVLDEAIQLDSAMGGTSEQSPGLHRLRGFALLRLSRLEEARAAFEESLLSGRAREAVFEVALTLRGLAEVLELADIADDGQNAAGLWSESQVIMDRLGVVSVPVIPQAQIT
jgi:tetratricopeptide (TPR) repeat protein